MFILPVNEDGYIGRRAYVLFAIVILNALVLAGTYVQFSNSDSLFLRYGFIPAHPQLSTLMSSMFLHAGFWHFAGNMFFLWMFGYRVENTFGRWLFALVYVVCGGGAAALHYAFNSASNIPCVGASGAISGIVGCYFVLFPKSRFDLVIILARWPVKTIRTYTHAAVGAWIAEQALLALLTQAVRFSSVAFWAHVGGFLTGAALTGLFLLIAPQLRARGEQPLIVRHIRGKVRDAIGRPLADVRFEVHADFHPAVAAVTDAGGRFTLLSVPDGTYSYRVTKAQFQPLEGTVVVQKKKRVPLSLRLTMSAATEAIAMSKGQSNSASG